MRSISYTLYMFKRRMSIFFRRKHFSCATAHDRTQPLLYDAGVPILVPFFSTGTTFSSFLNTVNVYFSIISEGMFPEMPLGRKCMATLSCGRVLYTCQDRIRTSSTSFQKRFLYIIQPRGAKRIAVFKKSEKTAPEQNRRRYVSLHLSKIPEASLRSSITGRC